MAPIKEPGPPPMTASFKRRPKIEITGFKDMAVHLFQKKLPLEKAAVLGDVGDG
jgi:hypothetical protein